MTRIRPRLSAARAALAVAAAVMLLSVTACTATSGTSDGGDPAASPSAATETPSADAADDATSAQDEVTCSAFGDVQTMLFNAQAAFYDERMTQRELDAWSALASRVLGNITAAEEGRVGEALAAVQEAVPAVEEPLGPSNIISPREWDVPGAELLAACEAAGFPVVTNGFIGG